MFRWNDIEVVGLELHAIRRLAHGHRGVPGQQVHHHAFMRRVEMLDQNESHAIALGQRADQLPAGLKAAGRAPMPTTGKAEGPRGGPRTATLRPPGRGRVVLSLKRVAIWHLSVVVEMVGFRRGALSGVVSNACRDKLRNVPSERPLGARSVSGKSRGADLGEPRSTVAKLDPRDYPRLPLANLSPL